MYEKRHNHVIMKHFMTPSSNKYCFDFDLKTTFDHIVTFIPLDQGAPLCGMWKSICGACRGTEM